jgi:pilus assembly protein CpaF
VNGTTLLLPDSAEVGGRVVRLAASLRPDRLFVASLAGDVIPQVVEAIGDGADSVIAGVRGPSLRHALARLAPALSAARTGLDAAGARSWIAASFDVAIEVARLPGGRHRVLRMAELTIGESGELAPRDIFELALDPTGAGEGTFAATGVVPALVADLRARGHRVDDSVYRRGAR